MAVDTPPESKAEADLDSAAGTSSHLQKYKTPSPPPSLLPLEPVVTSTPPTKKATNNYPYASERKDRTLMNLGLARETKGHFLGAMPPEQFLDEYLPIQAGLDEPSQDELEGCFDVVNAGSLEKGMYPELIEVISPHLAGMVILNTSAHSDADRDGLSPDLALYDDYEVPEKGRTDMSKMSTFMECKKSANADPFTDPEDGEPISDDFIFERDTHNDHKGNRGQISSYSAAISGCQFRVHVFSVSICGQMARFLRWDRSGTIVSRAFNYVQSPHLLIGFFFRYSRLHRLQQGYDPTVSRDPAEPEDVRKLMTAGFALRMKKANKAHQEFRRIMVPDRDDAREEKEKPFLISYPPFYETRSPFSRATRAMLAFDLTTRKLVYLKDYWRPNVEGMEKEGEIYRTLQEKNVPHIAPFGTGNDVRNQETVAHLWTASPRLPWVTPTSKLICLRHYRMTLDTVGRGLLEFESSHQFIRAIADAMEAHDGAFFDCLILHRDISVGNIIITDDNEGLLIDWDLCIRLQPDGKPSVARRPTRTGTWQFMSAALLQDSNRRHDYQDDRESAFYVLLWVGLRYTVTNAAPGCSTFSRSKILQAFDETLVDEHGHISGGERKELLMSKYEQKGIQFTDRPSMDKLMTELASILHARYSLPTQADYRELQEEIAEGSSERIIAKLAVSKHQAVVRKLEMRGWLVNTIREYLNLGTWPEDKAEPQVIQGTKRRAAEDQIILDERATKKRSSLHVSSSAS